MLPQFKRDADGGLTLLIQNESPGQGQGSELAPRTQGAILRGHAPLLAEARGDRWQLEKTADENSEVIRSRQMNGGASQNSPRMRNLRR